MSRWFFSLVSLVLASVAIAEDWEPDYGPAREERHSEDFVSTWTDDDDKLYERPLSDPKPTWEVHGPSAKSSKSSSPVKISGVLFDGRLTGDPEPEEAIRLTNTDLVNAADVGDFSISDRYGPPRHAVASADSAANSPRYAKLPSGTKIPPGGEMWISANGQAFTKLFGFKPDFEGVDTRGDVEQVDIRTGWPTWNALRGIVTLHDAFGEVVDLVPYDRSKHGDGIDKKDIPQNQWEGPSVLLFHASPFGWTGQILARDRDEKGRLLPDTNTAADWDSSFSKNQLGRDPIHRVEYPGQSRFVFEPFVDDMEILAASAPENAYSALEKAIAEAKKEILVSLYQWESDHIADLLIAARKRGVEVVAYLEGSPVGGLPDQERYVTEKLKAAGIPVWFLISHERDRIRNRYRFDHSKYLIIDKETVIIGTENFGYTGHPVDPSFGNRGWMVHVKNKKLAAQLRQIWEDDFDPMNHSDLVEISDDPADNWGFPYRKPPFQLRRAVVGGSYPHKRAPLRVKAKTRVELVACPDNCLSEKTALIGLMNEAKESLLVLQNSIPLWWSKKKTGSIEHTPNLPLQAVVNAARRGVRVRVLLDGTWYNVESNDVRDNDDTVRYLNELARKENLDLEAKVINLVSTHVEKIHAKGLIADGKRVFVGSINWTENSFKANREIGLVIDNKEVSNYYSTLFQRDWAMTRLYQAAIVEAGASVRARPNAESKLVAPVKGGTLLDVMSENGAWLEVRLDEQRTGYLPVTAVEELVAVPSETPALLGRAAKVRGRVRSVHVSRAGVALNFGVTWRSDFSILIPRGAVKAFEEAGLSLPAAFDGQEIEARGELFEKDGPQMKVESPALIRVIR